MLLPPEQLSSLLDGYTVPPYAHLLTPRGAPLTLVTTSAAAAAVADHQLRRVADLYAYDAAMPLSSTNVDAIEAELSTRWHQVVVHGRIIHFSPHTALCYVVCRSEKR